MSSPSTPLGTRGRLFIVSAPSGTGKTTLVERLVHIVPELRMSRSYTSRPARPGERDGVDYNFISRPQFEDMIRAGAFLEYADVFGNYYGTGRADTQAALAQGLDVVLVIDVQGARQVRRGGVETVGIFVLPPSADILERRLRGRGNDSEDQIVRRLEVARQEVPEFAAYDYVVVNDEVELAVGRLQAIVLAERGGAGPPGLDVDGMRTPAMRAAAEAIIGTFKRNARGTSTQEQPV